MIQNVLKEIGGVGIYGVISVCLFCALFGGALLSACLHKKAFINRMSTLPLEDSGTQPDPKGDSHHE